MEDTKLDLDRVVSETIALLSAEGLEGVSLRKLATRLGVRAPSLYWYFPNKAALFAAVIERAFLAYLAQVPTCQRWQDWMREFAKVVWRSQADIRDFGILVMTIPLSPEQVAHTTHRLREQLRGLDLPEDDAFRFQSTIQALMVGWSAFAHAPYAAALDEALSVEELAMRNVETLIRGWEEELRTGRLQHPSAAPSSVGEDDCSFPPSQRDHAEGSEQR